MHDYCLRNDLDCSLGEMKIEDILIDKRIWQRIPDDSFEDFLNCVGLKLCVTGGHRWYNLVTNEIIFATKYGWYINFVFSDRTIFESVIDEIARLKKDSLPVSMVCFGNIINSEVDIMGSTHKCLECEIKSEKQFFIPKA